MLGDLVRDLRLRQKMSQEEAAELGGFSSSWLSRLEANAIGTPSPTKLRVLARVLRVSADELLLAAGYIHHASSIEHMATDELADFMNRSVIELAKRAAQQAKPEPIRLDEHRDGTDPSVRRQSHGAVALMTR